jgi:hypothetical protein
LQPRNLRMYIPDFLYFQARALIGLDQREQASEVLEMAVAILQETEGRWQLWEIAALLADLAKARGDTLAVLRWQDTARTTIDAIAREISDLALRDTFLGQPKVTEILLTDRR